MKVLVYNFVQPGEPGKQGGGVSVYQRNLIKSLAADGHQVISFSAGDRYSVLKRPPFLKQSTDGRGSHPVARVILYNSPVLAPAHAAFYDLPTYLDSPALHDVPGDLRNRFGHIDVFHFQNIEGLTASFFLQLKRVFPEARLIVSAHNYSLVCPQVNLWFRETSACVDFQEGNACVNCIGGHGPHPQEMNLRRLDTILSLLGVRRHSRLSRLIEFTARLPFRLKRMLRRLSAQKPGQAVLDPTDHMRPRTIVSSELAAPYKAYRARNIELCRHVFDHVIAVSERTKAVLIANGVPSDNISVSYIGTAHHQRFLSATRKAVVGKHLHVAYLGYMRRDKGFFFFIECLHLVPVRLARRMEVTVAAPYGTDWPIEELKRIAHKFKAIHVHNGYTHATIDETLQDVDLGIVPVLWEDNLPQVAIEIVSRGIPILTSDKGGASEIAGRPDFIFRAGSKTELLTKLERIVDGTVPLADFWHGTLRLFSMEEHIADLMRYYRPTPPSEAAEARLADLVA